jgi:hypothetical protein
LRQLNPELVILDLAASPELGIKFAQFLGDSLPGIRFIAAGPTLTPDHLLTAMRGGVADTSQAGVRGIVPGRARSDASPDRRRSKDGPK